MSQIKPNLELEGRPTPPPTSKGRHQLELEEVATTLVPPAGHRRLPSQPSHHHPRKVARESVLRLARSRRLGPSPQFRPEISCHGNGQGDGIPPSIDEGGHVSFAISRPKLGWYTMAWSSSSGLLCGYLSWTQQ
jgi:hypothetical protein